ncbi:MAG: hypothetical protein J6Z49_00795 [Kiritimatiellae bacterium]|nr:hypothetical protein [Kiritimatiellia bacterium]
MKQIIHHVDFALCALAVGLSFTATAQEIQSVESPALPPLPAGGAVATQPAAVQQPVVQPVESPTLPPLPADGAVATQPAAIQQPVVQPVVQAEVSVTAANEDLGLKLNALQQVEAGFRTFAEKKQIVYGEPSSTTGIVYFKASAPVFSKPGDADFLSKREMAFNRAFDDVKIQNVKYTAGRSMSETVHNLTENNAEPDPSEFDQRMESIAAKVKALGEAKLDKALLDLGIDPERFEKKQEVKVLAYLDNLSRSSAAKAVGSCAGISVVKTFEGKGREGEYEIGVIAKYDPALQGIFLSVKNKVIPPPAPKPGVPLASLLTGNQSNNFGVRFYYNEVGAPCLLAFGQWGVSYQGNDVIRRRQAGSAAQKYAEAEANTMLNEFIAGSFVYSDNTKLGEVFERSNIFHSAGLLRETGVNKIIQQLGQESKTTASDQLKGRRVVYSEIVQHPHEGAGEVAVVAINWSFAQLEQAQQRLNGFTPRPPAPAPVAPPAKPTQGGLQVGQEYDF